MCMYKLLILLSFLTTGCASNGLNKELSQENQKVLSKKIVKEKKEFDLESEQSPLYIKLPKTEYKNDSSNKDIKVLELGNKYGYNFKFFYVKSSKLFYYFLVIKPINKEMYINWDNVSVELNMLGNSKPEVMFMNKDDNNLFTGSGSPILGKIKSNIKINDLFKETISISFDIK